MSIYDPSTLPPSRRDGDWSLGTLEGVRRDQARRAATSTVSQRLAWLEEMLRLAQASGALQRERELKQQAIDRAWRGGSGS